jgi:hypothetical protein
MSTEETKETMTQATALDKAGGRKAMAFYATLASCLLLALLDKAHGEILGLIDTLFFIYAGANVMSKRTAFNKKEEKTNE